MRVTPQAILAFGKHANLQLRSADVPRVRVVLGRLSTARAIRRGERRFLTTESFPASPQEVPQVCYQKPETAAASTGLPAGPPFELTATSVPVASLAQRQKDVLQLLPICCPGCGAFSQDINSQEAGYYTKSRKAVKAFLREAHVGSVFDHTSQQKESNQRRHAESQEEDTLKSNSSPSTPPLPVCDRCHDLIYNSCGVPVAHPSVESLADSIAESPFHHNHVYHVLDAADFPLSLIPSIHSRFGLTQPRTQNRRSQHKFSKRPTVSFIITRSDLLGPTKDIVDSLMPYFTSALRSALGRFGKDIRLGNVHLVSSKRGWWTKEIKESIWKRGGGNWMVGRVNVGKSNLFEVLFPKGSGDRAADYAELEKEVERDARPVLDQTNSQTPSQRTGIMTLSDTSLLPPPQPETPFPNLPLVSSLPGTTASPIRLPFGKHKGELIDLPGLARGNLDTFVLPDHRSDLVMKQRPTVTQHVIKSGQSLLLGGGLVRITPLFHPDVSPSDAVVLAYPFVPFDAHVTATEKAIGTQLQERESGITSILAAGVGRKTTSAGKFTLSSDVTRVRSGALLRAGVKLDKLAFKVFSTDILIEGVGWIELVCQVRRRRRQLVSPEPNSQSSLNPAATSERATIDSPSTVQDALSHLDAPPRSSSSPLPSAVEIQDLKAKRAIDLDPSFTFPVVEIFTPEGGGIGQRAPMGAWMLLNKDRRSKTARAAQHAARPRKPMKGMKKRARMAKRRAATAVA